MENSTTPPPDPTVYVVDHDPAVRDSLCRLLNAAGIETKSYASAECFLESFDPGRFACLVTEIELPGLSGLDLLERLRDRSVEPRAVVLTSRGEVRRAVQAMRSGAVDFLEKPFVDRILLQRVLEVLGRERS